MNADGLDDRSREVLESRRRSKVYQKQYQEALQKQIAATIDKLQADEYSTIETYLKDCYTDGYVGTMYDIANQGIPIIAPIDQASVVRAVLTDSKISKGLYASLGVDAALLKKQIASEVSRGIATGLSYRDMARNLNNVAGTGLSNARRIVRTEGHRIQNASAFDAQQTARAKGCEVVKQWDSTLDGRTRTTHRLLDGQIRETDEYFEIAGKKARYPGDFGDPAEDCNCRCALLTRARWALDEDELKVLQERARYFGLMADDSKTFGHMKEKTTFADFKEKYLKAAKTIENSAKSSRINTKLTNSKIVNGTTVTNPMDEAKYKQLKANLEKQGVRVIQAEGDDLRYLQVIGAEASYGNGYITHIGAVPSASGMFEEIIHSTQAKKYGEFVDSDPLELYAREIAANRKLLKNGKAYGFDETDFEDIEHNLSVWEEKFKNLVGVSYDESDYSRDV